MRKLPGSPLPCLVGKRSFGKDPPAAAPPSGSYRKHQGPKRFHSSSPSAFVSSLSASLFLLSSQVPVVPNDRMLYPFRRFARPLDTWVCARLDSCGGAATLGAASGPTGYQLRAGASLTPRKVPCLCYRTRATVPASQVIFCLLGLVLAWSSRHRRIAPRLTELYGVLRCTALFLFFFFCRLSLES